MNEKFGRFLLAARDAAAVAGGLAVGAAEGAGKLAEAVADSARLRLRAATLEGQVEGALMEVGELLYATHTGSPSDSEELQRKLEEIDALKAELAEVQGKLGREAGKVCPDCGETCCAGDAYCRRCGGKL